MALHSNDDIEVLKSKEVALSEILDRVLDKGVVISGDITISIADIDMIYLGLRVLLTSVDNLESITASPNQDTTKKTD
jgi:hypothetical protein